MILPKFRFEASVDLRSSLQNLGVKNAFKPGIADFTRMVGHESKVHVGTVLQKVYVEVSASHCRIVDDHAAFDSGLPYFPYSPLFSSMNTLGRGGGQEGGA